MSKHIKAIIIASTILSLFNGCVTDSRDSQKRPQAQLQPKEGSAAAEASAANSENYVSNNSQELAFVEQMTVENPRELTPSDHDMIAGLSQKVDQTSLDRAILVLAGLRLTLQMQTQVQQYQEIDLFKSEQENQEEKKQENYTAAGQMAKYNLDLANELTRNPILQSQNVFSLAIKATKRDESKYRAAIVEVCMNKLKEWAKFHQFVSSIPTQDGEDDAISVEDPSSVADVRLADLTLVEAERLAERKNYQEAVKLAQSIPERNPLSRSAQDKVRTFSNLAVQELRRKAALAFQNAMPVNDLRIKQSYLNEAKTYLEAALTEYPGAEQLGKIKENLAVISKDLENINDQLGDSEEED